MREAQIRMIAEDVVETTICKLAEEGELLGRPNERTVHQIKRKVAGYLFNFCEDKDDKKWKVCRLCGNICFTQGGCSRCHGHISR